MKNRTTLLALFLTVVLAQTGCALPYSGQSTSSVDRVNSRDLRYQRTDRKAFRRTGYAAIGVGLSRLDPDTSEVPSVDVNDRVNNGGQITVGTDLSRQLSLELHSADLGSAGLSPEGRINYHVLGGSALFYMGKNRHRYRRTGLSGYGRIGIGQLDNSAVGDSTRYEQVNGLHALFGLGAEYVTRVGVGIRGEYIAFDKDVSYGQLALTYRLGRKAERDRMVVVEAPEAEPAPVIAPVAAVAVLEIDSDNDGVLDNEDECPDSSKSASVDAEGCVLFAGVLRGVNFYSNSATLTEQAKVILDGVAVTLSKYPNVPVRVMAHTDSRGAKSYNQSLSEGRADSVIAYLGSRGIDINRLKPSAYGETQPIASNDTPEGRLENRRVELFAERPLLQ